MGIDTREVTSPHESNSVPRRVSFTEAMEKKSRIPLVMKRTWNKLLSGHKELKGVSLVRLPRDPKIDVLEAAHYLPPKKSGESGIVAVASDLKPVMDYLLRGPGRVIAEKTAQRLEIPFSKFTEEDLQQWIIAHEAGHVISEYGLTAEAVMAKRNAEISGLPQLPASPTEQQLLARRLAYKNLPMETQADEFAENFFRMNGLLKTAS